MILDIRNKDIYGLGVEITTDFGDIWAFSV
jgi:hypothetical protein